MTDLSSSTAHAWVDVDLSALRANARTIAGLSRCPLLPMVKANGYGLGAVAVARALEREAPWGLGVATPGEGAELRAHGITRPILVFAPIFPMDAPLLRQHALRPVIGDLAALEAWLASGDAPFHLEIDTGMARGGVRWHDGAGIDRLGRLLAHAPGWEGVLTHFHSGEDDPASVQRQCDRFTAVLAHLPRRPALVHVANSVTSVDGAAAGNSLVRPGIFLYGGTSIGAAAAPVRPRPVAALRTRVIGLRTLGAEDTVSYGATWTAGRTRRIATLAIGYADGVLRALSNRGMVELCGQVVPIVGRVTMDLTMVALPDSSSVAIGDVATVWGGAVSLESQALAAGTIPYELLTGLSGRVERRYNGGDA